MNRPETRNSGPELCALSAREAVRMLKQGEVSPGELLEASLQRVDQVNADVNATVIHCPERAEAAITRLHEKSAVSDHPGWLAGLTVGIKDLIDVAGLPNTCGSPALANYVPECSDPLIERLEGRGAVIGGKTNTPEFGAGANTFNAVFGATRNPWNTDMNAGGSSGGSAAALATGQFWLCHGSDLAGSLRTPASFCGVVGFRPSPGRAGGGPADTAFSPEAVDGPMARDVLDAALLLDAMCGYDARQPLSLPEPEQTFQIAARQNPGSIRVAFAEDLNGFAPVEMEVREVLRSAMAEVQGEGLIVEEACPMLDGLNETYLTLRGIHYGAVTDYLPQEAKRHFKRTLRENAEFGRNLTAAAIYEAMRNKTRLYQTMRGFLEQYDVLALPNTGIAPGPVEVEYPPSVDGVIMDDYVEWLKFSFLATTTGLPALSMPAGFTSRGMPVGIQLIGPPRGEARLLQVARALEQRLDLPSVPIDPLIGGGAGEK
ncbi:MAG: amidase family protein [Rhodobacteraceae bacterium]|nr:amidase family protein [Paracoccaceae bacterium]